MTTLDNCSCSSAPTSPERRRPETACIHSPWDGRLERPLLTPIVQSTTFVQPHVGANTRHAYSRVSNPTVDALECTLGSLENAPPAVCFGTGLAAETALLLAFLKAGDHVVCGKAVYGGTVRLLQQTLAGFGVSSSFVDTTEPELVRAGINTRTRLVFIETPANPTLVLSDIRAIAEICRAAGVLLAVDNTFLTPLLQQPLDFGADLSVYSTTKFIEGHSAAMGGALVSRKSELLDRLRFLRKCTGGIQAPLNAWLTIQGVKTLAVRIREQSRSTQAIAEWLAAHPRIGAVNYPGLPDFPQRTLAASQHIGAHGAVLSFEVEGGAEAGRRFMNAVQLCSLVEHVGSVETLITHPATMTHADVPREQRAAVGIGDGLIRLSVGLENPADIIADLSAAIDVATEGRAAAGREGAACPAR